MFFQILGAFEGDTLRAYTISVRKATPTMTIDFRSPDSSFEAGYELLRWLFSHEYRPPLFASDVFENSYAHRTAFFRRLHREKAFRHSDPRPAQNL